MKKIATLTFIISILITPLNALEKRDCSGLKKISKAYVACKSGNFKAGIVNTGSKIKKGTVGKIKDKKKNKKKSSFIITPTTKIKKKDKKVVKKKIEPTTKAKASNDKLKEFWAKRFKKGTKQYPKGAKK